MTPPQIRNSTAPVGAGAYTGPWAEVVFGPYKGGSFITIRPRYGLFLSDRIPGFIDIFCFAKFDMPPLAARLWDVGLGAQLERGSACMGFEDLPEVGGGTEAQAVTDLTYGKVGGGEQCHCPFHLHPLT